LDHFDNTNMDTYSQRYFVNDEFFNPQDDKAPVMLFIGAEGVMRYVSIPLHRLPAHAFSPVSHRFHHHPLTQSQVAPARPHVRVCLQARREDVCY
jgi:hypothetical protein